MLACNKRVESYFNDFTILTKIFSSSTQSANIEVNSASVKKPVEPKRLIQYFVSEVSFRAIFIFDTKSAAL